MKLSEDPEIARILSEPEGDTPADHLELLTALTGQVVLGGRSFPAPTLGTHALLHLIRSPFLFRSGPEPDSGDLTNALFILSEPKTAAGMLFRRTRCEQTFQSLLDEDELTAADRGAMAEAIGEERKFRRQWHRTIRNFARKLRLPRPDHAAAELKSALSPGIGFSMIPQSDSGSGPQVLNLETVTNIAAGLTAIIPGLSLEELCWKIPVVTVGFLMVQTARKNGLAGVSRDETSQKLWQRFQVLQNRSGQQETPERRPSSETAKIRERLRKHLDRIRNAADLRNIPDLNGTVKPEENRRHPAAVRLDIHQPDPGTGPRNGMPQQTVSPLPSGRSDRIITARFTVPAPADTSGRPDALHALRDSVEHIENILKQQLPDGIV
ncbi:MAG: hypothetical protein J5806_13505 [Lentisphaeria bacterium]|nr:hypothetical protein [Lentisphaeria bacterium]